VCLSIDVGSQHAGICLYDAEQQQVLYLNKHKLLEVHQAFVTDTAEVQRCPNDITLVVETLLQGRDYWVLVEQQFMDADAAGGLYFNIQLQQCIAMYYLQKGKQVQTIHPTKRYPFLGIHGWRQDSRAARKAKVVRVVSRLLDPNSTLTGNQFSSTHHNLLDWETHTQKHDMADALAQCLSYYYRHLTDVLECRTVRLGTAGTAAATPLTQTPCSTSKRQKTAQQDVSPATRLRAQLQRTLSQLQISHYDALRGLSNNAERLQAVWRRDPETPASLPSCKASTGMAGRAAA
jgi:Holliday junction resolvasome RuvABC endonuclease subunit